MLRRFGFLERLRRGEKVIADKGYVCAELSHQIVTPIKSRNLTENEELFNRAVSAVRILVERVNQLIKRFAIMSHVFRHDIVLHGVVFRVICHLINLRIELCPLVKKPHRVLRGLPVVFEL